MHSLWSYLFLHVHFYASSDLLMACGTMQLRFFKLGTVLTYAFNVVIIVSIITTVVFAIINILPLLSLSLTSIYFLFFVIFFFFSLFSFLIFTDFKYQYFSLLRQSTFFFLILFSFLILTDFFFIIYFLLPDSLPVWFWQSTPLPCSVARRRRETSLPPLVASLSLAKPLDLVIENGER